MSRRYKIPEMLLLSLLRLLSAEAIFHMYEGRTVAQPGTILGHESLGVVEEVERM
jgi:hypothetical protein